MEHTHSAIVYSWNMAACIKPSDVKKLEYSIHKCSSYSSTYVPEWVNMQTIAVTLFSVSVLMYM